ncbi:hypothetical protein ACVIOG_002294 [Rhizobium leguminosarum]
MELISAWIAGLQVFRRGFECGREDGQRIAIAARCDRIDRSLLVFDARIRLEQQHCARRFHRILDLCVLFGRQRRVQQVEIGGVGIFQEALRRGKPRGTVRAHQRQLAGGGANDAAKRVVDLDLRHQIRIDICSGFAGDRIGIGRFVIGTPLEKNRAAIRIDVEKAVAQLLQDLADMLVLGGDQRFDGRFAFREVADAERVDEHMDIVLSLGFARDYRARKCQARKCQANRDEENLYGAIHRLSRP